VNRGKKHNHCKIYWTTAYMYITSEQFCSLSFYSADANLNFSVLMTLLYSAICSESPLLGYLRMTRFDSSSKIGLRSLSQSLAKIDFFHQQTTHRYNNMFYLPSRQRVYLPERREPKRRQYAYITALVFGTYLHSEMLRNILRTYLA